MKIHDKIKSFYFLVLISAIILLAFPFAYDYIIYSEINIGNIDKLLIYFSLSDIIFVNISWIGLKYLKNVSIKLQIFAIVLYLLISTIIIVLYSINFNKNNYSQWNIASYELQKNQLNKFIANKITNPIIQAKDITDLKAEFTADPFLVKVKNEYFIFFEIFNSKLKKGEIGLASSHDGIKWKYEKSVLSESFHLSFPCIFEWEGSYFMMPESSGSKSIRLYKSVDFPFIWKYSKTILSGKNYLDNIIFEYNNLWWLFTSTSNDNLLLYYSKSPVGIWTPHPNNPIKSNNPETSRMAGNILVKNDSLIRFAQDDYPNYGNSIRSFIITKLDTLNYSEKEISLIPKFRGKNKFSLNGSHTISILESEKSYLIVVDEY